MGQTSGAARPWRTARVRRSAIDAELRVERVDAVLAGRAVGLRAQVGSGGVVGGRAEAVAEALGEVHAAAVDVVEQDALPPAVRRRADPDVDDDVEHRAVVQVTYLAWPGGTSAKWMPRTTPARGDRMLPWASRSGCPTSAARWSKR